MKRTTSRPPAQILEPKTIRMPRKDHQPSKAEM